MSVIASFADRELDPSCGRTLTSTTGCAELLKPEKVPLQALHEHGARGISSVERIQKVTNTCGGSDIPALHFRKAQFAPPDHVYELANGGINLRLLFPLLQRHCQREHLNDGP